MTVISLVNLVMGYPENSREFCIVFGLEQDRNMKKNIVKQKTADAVNLKSLREDAGNNLQDRQYLWREKRIWVFCVSEVTVYQRERSNYQIDLKHSVCFHPHKYSLTQWPSAFSDFLCEKYLEICLTVNCNSNQFTWLWVIRWIKLENKYIWATSRSPDFVQISTSTCICFLCFKF